MNIIKEIEQIKKQISEAKTNNIVERLELLELKYEYIVKFLEYNLEMQRPRINRIKQRRM